jgi:hypothetical protein
MHHRRTKLRRLARVLIILAMAVFWMGPPRPPGVPGCRGPRPPTPLHEAPAAPAPLR